MATDDFGMGIPVPPDSTKVKDFPLVTRQGLNKIAEILSGQLPESVADAAAEAVALALSAEDIVTGDDPRALQRRQAEGILIANVDADDRRTWLEARDSDGGPTEWAIGHVRTRLGIPVRNEESGGILFSITDQQDRMTDGTYRLSDGQLAEFVVQRLAPRIAQYLTLTPSKTIIGADKYVRGAELLPVLTDMTRVAGWGSSSMEGINSQFQLLAADYGATYYNGGKGGERSDQIAARLGSRRALLTVAGGSVPASGPVVVTASNMVSNANMRSYTGTLAGIPGTVAYSATDAALTFTRTTAGTATPVAAGTPFTPTAGMQYRDAVNVLWMGKNDFDAATPGAELPVIQRTDEAFDWLAPLVRRVLVMGHFADGNTSAGSEERRQIVATNAAHAARYGQQFIDVYALLTSPEIWVRTGITPTQADLDQQAIGNKPTSISSDNGHLNAAGYKAVRDYVQERITALGWY